MGNNLAPIIEELRRAYIVLKQDVFDKHVGRQWDYDDKGNYTLVEKPANMPMPVITVQARGRKKVDGWYKPTAWNSQAAQALNVLAGTTNGHQNRTVASTDEICIAAEALDKSAEDLLVILMHQMVHHFDHHMHCGGKGYNRTQNENGYHTRDFQYQAQNFGLEAEIDGSAGWRKTTISNSGSGRDLKEAIKKINLDTALFDMFRKSQNSSDPVFKGSKLKKWSCNCTNVRVATILHSQCRKCGTDFKYSDKDREDSDIKAWLHNAGEETI